LARPAGSVVLLLGLTALPAIAQASGDNIEIHGFLLGNFSGRINGQRPGGDGSSDFLLAEERLRLDLGAWPESIEASAGIKGDFVHDAITNEFDIDLREAYIDYSTGDFDFRLGRQIATWGVGDLIFINDVFPKDWVSFFSGRPLEYLKIGVDGLRTRYSSKRVNAELFVIPLFEPDNLPTPDRFFLFDPFAPVRARRDQKPATTYGNTELALRLYGKISEIDISVYAYRGFWRTPGLRPDNFLAPSSLTRFYPDLSVYGISAQANAFGGVLSFEAGYYDSRDDAGGADPAIANSQVRFLAGYQRQLWREATLGIQYYVEVMEDHSGYRNSLPAGFPVQKEYRDIVTLRIDQLLEHQRWKLSMMCFYSPADHDYLLQPQVTYKFSDDLAATIGANIFGGARNWTSFGQFEKNDNVYFSARFDF
jgi:hypothetical protein